jgi:hypothetical protein
MRAVDDEFGEPEERRWQIRASRPTREEPRQECRIFEIIDPIIGDFQNAAEDLGSRNTSNGQTRLLNDVIGAAFCLLCLGRVPRQCVFAGSGLAQCRAQTIGDLDDDARVPASIREEALFGRSKMIEELGPHLIADSALPIGL